MNDLDLAQVLDPEDDLLKNGTCLLLCKSVTRDNIIEELTSFSHFHDQVQALVGLDHLVQLDQVRVSQNLQDMNLTGHPLDVGVVLDLLLFKYFDGHHLTCQDVRSTLHLPEGSLTQGLAYHKMPTHPTNNDQC